MNQSQLYGVSWEAPDQATPYGLVRTRLYSHSVAVVCPAHAAAHVAQTKFDDATVYGDFLHLSYNTCATSLLP